MEEHLIKVMDPFTLDGKTEPNRSYPVEQFLDERIQAGWRPIVRQLVADLFDLGWNGEVMQVKEKFGRFCFNLPLPEVFPVPEPTQQDIAINRRILRAQKDSFNFCELCGEPGFLCRSVDSSLLKTLCVKHLSNKSGSFARFERTERG